MMEDHNQKENKPPQAASNRWSCSDGKDLSPSTGASPKVPRSIMGRLPSQPTIVNSQPAKKGEQLSTNEDQIIIAEDQPVTIDDHPSPAENETQFTTAIASPSTPIQDNSFPNETTPDLSDAASDTSSDFNDSISSDPTFIDDVFTDSFYGLEQEETLAAQTTKQLSKLADTMRELRAGDDNTFPESFDAVAAVASTAPTYNIMTTFNDPDCADNMVVEVRFPAFGDMEVALTPYLPLGAFKAMFAELMGLGVAELVFLHQFREIGNGDTPVSVSCTSGIMG